MASSLATLVVLTAQGGKQQVVLRRSCPPPLFTTSLSGFSLRAFLEPLPQRRGGHRRLDERWHPHPRCGPRARRRVGPRLFRPHCRRQPPTARCPARVRPAGCHGRSRQGQVRRSRPCDGQRRPTAFELQASRNTTPQRRPDRECQGGVRRSISSVSSPRASAFVPGHLLSESTPRVVPAAEGAP